MKNLIWASLPIPIFLIDLKSQIVDVNYAGESFINTSAQSAKGDYIWNKVKLDLSLKALLKRAREDKTPIFVNDVDILVVNRILECSLKIAPVLGVDDLMLIMISPRELASRSTHIHSPNSNTQSAIGMAEMLAHETKNPLAGIIGAAQLLSMKIGPEAYELSDHIVSEGRRIEKLLGQVEQFGNLPAPTLTAINIHDVLDRAKQSAHLGFGSNLTIFKEYDPSLPTVMGDPDQLLQVILNLLKNASEVSSEQSVTVTLRTFFEHSFKLRRRDSADVSLPLQVEIIDDGPGIESSIIKSIFDPFVSSKKNGTGLGLALAAKIISDHNGWISVTSVPGRTAFRLSLPRASV
ncbi:MAG: ATP-binding protein [Aestuariivita sp.]|nr:ATP-binding protein [Aestuariivita sp.]